MSTFLLKSYTQINNKTIFSIVLKAICKIDFLRGVYDLRKFPIMTIACTIHSDVIRSNVLAIEKKKCDQEKEWRE